MTFLAKLFSQVKSNITEEANILKPQQEVYQRALDEGSKILNAIDTPDKALAALESIRSLDHALTSKKELEAAFKEVIKALNYEYDKKLGQYVLKENAD